jgi:hypothetical protein
MYHLLQKHFGNIKKFSVNDSDGAVMSVVPHYQVIANIQLFMDEMNEALEEL